MFTTPSRPADPQPGTRSAPEHGRYDRARRERAGYPVPPPSGAQPGRADQREPIAVLADVLSRDGAEQSASAIRQRNLAHAVLDAGLLPRRAWSAGLIGQALVAAALGSGHRRIARDLDVPAGTVRGWVRGARRSAVQLRVTAIRAVVAAGHEMPTRWPPGELGFALENLGAAAWAMGQPARAAAHEPVGAGQRADARQAAEHVPGRRAAAPLPATPCPLTSITAPDRAPIHCGRLAAPASPVPRRRSPAPHHLATLHAIWAAETQAARHDRYCDLVTAALPPGHRQPLSHQARWLYRTLHAAELAGLDPAEVIRTAITSRDLAGSRDIAAVLDARIRPRIDPLLP